MTRYLLDTGKVQEFINHRGGVRERADHERHRGNRIGTCVPVVGELWSGVEGSTSRARNAQRLELALSRLVVWPYTMAAAAEFGRIFAELRRRGRPMQQVDIQIAAIALSLRDCIVVTCDRDLGDVSGLTVENWP